MITSGYGLRNIIVASCRELRGLSQRSRQRLNALLRFCLSTDLRPVVEQRIQLHGRPEAVSSASYGLPGDSQAVRAAKCQFVERIWSNRQQIARVSLGQRRERNRQAAHRTPSRKRGLQTVLRILIAV